MLYGQVFGYQRIAEMLVNEGIFTTRGSVERLIKGKGTYQGRRVVVEHSSGGDGCES